MFDEKKGEATVVGDVESGDEFTEVEIIDPKDLVVLEGQVRYTGTIISVHDGFSYIGRIKRGYETINTNGDVFVPAEFPVNGLVEFDELNDDPKRPGKFRTESARLAENALTEVNKETRAAALMKISERSIYHLGAKKIDPEQVRLAAENEPFAQMLGIHKRAGELTGQEIVSFAENSLKGTFACLASAGVNYSIGADVNKDAEKALIDEAVRAYQANGMDGQIQSIREEYAKFSGIRDAFILMRANGLLSAESIVPIRYLPDLLVTAPVWFVSARERLEDLTDQHDPRPDHAVKFFCDVVGTKEFAWLYQIYNRRTRPLKTFSGRDIVSLPIMKIIESARNKFDYLVIATPYHDITSREWVDPQWLRSLDPFLFGFMKGLPFMFLLGRWSGTGLFPLLCDMIADTIDHLRLNHKKLKNFRSNAYWYKGLDSYQEDDGILLGGSNNHGGNNVLVPFALEVIKAFEEGRLFEFLRGEEKEKMEVKIQ